MVNESSPSSGTSFVKYSTRTMATIGSSNPGPISDTRLSVVSEINCKDIEFQDAESFPDSLFQA
jgi:hypothetical protein